MSLKKRLEGKSEGLGETAADQNTLQPAVRGPRTAPGQMLAFRDQMNETSAQIAELETRLQAFQGSIPTRKLDPQRIRASKLANRNEASYERKEFLELKVDIAAGQGNVQPIKVRPIAGDASADYEIIFGHRRHRACLELGLDVLSVIEDVSDVDLFLAMDRENREREDLTPFELGMHYRRALEAKLWPSQNQMAQALGVSQSLVSKALQLAHLPECVVAAFPSPLDLQFRWGQVLTEKISEHEDEVLRIAKRLAAEKGQHSAQRVFDALSQRKTGPLREVVIEGRRVASIWREGNQIVVKFAGDSVDPERLEQLEDAIKSFLARGA